ncbi:hypothetical protein RRG08_049203 [Elysia crispata]|uniref:Uncharacterized protein n=1 Tax=Elysia crispata TaxID=231223 RepID=A0AAE1E6P7_9GAST|nr:hypothetical protein RRG08_049203 [Elysia crispata]
MFHLRSDNYTFPEIKASRSFGVTDYIKIFIGVGLVALLATVAGLGVMCYKKYGGAEAISNNAQGLAPAIDRTQMETEHQKETVEKLQEADDEVQNLDTSQNTVSSQTDVTSV